MSESMNTRINVQSFRRQLLTTASAAALLVSVFSASVAEAADGDDDRPPLWIELGGQLERVDGGQEPFSPPFVAGLASDPFASPAIVQRPPQYSNGAQAKISFEPDDTNWIFSASVRYGRSNGSKNEHQETVPPTPKLILSVPTLHIYQTDPSPARSKKFSDTTAKSNETHAVLDFQAGKDVGLGMFGEGGLSQVNFGIRFAQFTSKSQTSLGANPDFQVLFHSFTQERYISGQYVVLHVKRPFQKWHLDGAAADISRDFRGLGPSISWDASAPLVGNPRNAEFTFDWGANAALLFGRQKVRAHHQTMQQYNSSYHFNGTLPIVYHHSYNPGRNKTVIVPNIGGFAGVSLKFPNAKISLGYRGDFFFGAMDGGIDVAKKENSGFYGPFATISIGLGG